MSASCPLCKAPGPSDTKHHLYHECPSTDELRQDLHDSLCIELAPRLGIRKSKEVATHMIARPDYYTGRVGMSIKDELEKNSEGDPPEHGDLSLTLLHHSLEMRALRESAIEASAAATKDNISIYDAQKFKIAWWAAQAAERAAKKKMQAETATFAGRKQQRQQKGRQRATLPTTPPPPVPTTPHYAYPIPEVPLLAIQDEPRKRMRSLHTPATPQNPTPNTPPSSPARDLAPIQHEATPSPPGKRALKKSAGVRQTKKTLSDGYSAPRVTSKDSMKRLEGFTRVMLVRRLKIKNGGKMGSTMIHEDVTPRSGSTSPAAPGLNM
jgi:hypothetical protein